MAYSLYDAAVTPCVQQLGALAASSIKPPPTALPTRSRNRLSCRTGYIRICSASPAKFGSRLISG